MLLVLSLSYGAVLAPIRIYRFHAVRRRSSGESRPLALENILAMGEQGPLDVESGTELVKRSFDNLAQGHLALSDSVIAVLPRPYRVDCDLHR